MTDHVAIYDPELEIGAIVDTDTMRGVGPVGVGPHSRAELAAFIDAMPEAVFALSTFDLSLAWMQFWQANFRALHESGDAGAASQMVEGGDDTGDDARLAEREASAAGAEPPPPGPADTDMEADASAADAVAGNGAEAPPMSEEIRDAVRAYEGPCFNCNATGQVPASEPGQVVVCPVCKGTRELPAKA